MTRKPYAIFASFLLNLAFLLGMAFFVGFFYELSDDWFIARNIANGQYNQVFYPAVVRFCPGMDIPGQCVYAAADCLLVYFPDYNLRNLF